MIDDRKLTSVSTSLLVPDVRICFVVPVNVGHLLRLNVIISSVHGEMRNLEKQRVVSSTGLAYNFNRLPGHAVGEVIALVVDDAQMLGRVAMQITTNHDLLTRRFKV